MTRLGRALLIAFVAVLALASAPTHAGEAEEAEPIEPGPVTYVGVGSLRWSDLSPTVTPTLWRLVGDSSVASMSVRSARDVSCPLDAWLTISGGSKALAAEPTGDRSSLNPGQLTGEVPASCAEIRSPADGTVPHWRSYVALQDEESGSYARLGAIGSALHDAGVCSTAIGAGAAVGLASRGGRIPRYEDAWSAAAQNRCPVTMVDAGDLTGGYDDPSVSQLRRIDSLVTDVVESAPNGSSVIVSGMADRDHAPALPQVVLVHETGASNAAWLTSETTRRQGYVHIADVGATLLAVSGAEHEYLDARPMTAGEQRGQSIAETVDDREDVAAMSRVIPEQGPVFGAWIVAVPVAVMVASLVALVARRRGARWARHRLFVRVGIVAALFAAAIPCSLYLATAARWWHSDRPTLTLAAVVVAIAVAITVLCLLIRWRRPFRVVAVQAGLTYAVLTIDGLVGTPLQVGSLLAAGPVFGGRFFGFGNVTFVVYAVSALLTAAVVAQELRWRGRDRAAVASATVIGAIAVIVDGWPTFGADFGGMLSLVPGVLLLALLLAGVRLGIGRLAAVAGTGFVVVAVVSYLDYLRPAAERSHFGSFVARLRAGDAWDLLSNKLEALFASVSGPVGWLEVAGFLACVAAVVAPTRLHVPELDAVCEAWPTLRPALLSVAATCAIASVVNDSGVLIAGLAVVTTAPVIIATCAWFTTDDRSHREVSPDGVAH